MTTANICHDKVMGGYYEPQLEQTLFTLLKGAGGATQPKNPKSSHLTFKSPAGLFKWLGLRELKFNRSGK